MRLKTRLATVAIAAAALTVTACLPASADGTTGAASYIAQTTSMTPVQLVGGSGVYSYASTVCADVNLTPQAGVCSAASGGTYTNIVCGTGTMSGTQTVTVAGNSVTVSYNITYMAGVGIITGPGPSVPPIGVVVLAATGPSSPPNCTTQYTLAELVIY
jgi:hypothetical protein